MDRTTKWGNPWRSMRDPEGGWMVACPTGAPLRGLPDKIEADRQATALFAAMLETPAPDIAYPSKADIRAELRGHDLACWCPIWDEASPCPACGGSGLGGYVPTARTSVPGGALTTAPCRVCEGKGDARYPCHRQVLLAAANA